METVDVKQMCVDTCGRHRCLTGADSKKYLAGFTALRCPALPSAAFVPTVTHNRVLSA